MGEVSCTYWGKERCNTGFCWEYLSERDHLEDICVDGRIILKICPQEIRWRHGLNLSGSEEEQMASACESSNELAL